MFGFGSSENEYEQPQQASFLGNIGSMIWTGLKMAFFAVLAIVTLGTVFKMSSTASNFVDSYTGSKTEGDGKGLASTIKGWLDKIVNPVKDFLNPTPKDDKPAITNIITVKSEKIGEADVLLPNAALTNSSINQNPEAFKVLADINGARKQYSAAMVSSDEGRAANDALNQLRNQERTYLREVDAWNSAIINKGNEKVPGAPQAHVIPIALPDVDKNALLHNIGVTKFSAVWNSSTPLQKILYLEQEIGASSDPIQRPAGLLPADRSTQIPATLRDANDVNEIILLRPKSKLDGVLPPAISTDNNPKQLAKNANAVVSNLIEEGRFGEATLVADTIISRLEIRGSQLNDNEKTKGQEYKSAMASMKETREYAATLELRRELDPILSETYAAGRSVAAIAPQKINEYQNQISEYRKNIELAKAMEKGSSVTTDATTLPPPARESGQAAGQGR